MPRKYFVGADGVFQGECVTDNPANPMGLEIVEIDEANIPQGEDAENPLCWRMKNGKVHVDQEAAQAIRGMKARQQRQERAAVVAQDSFVIGLLSIDPDDMDAYIEQNINTIGDIKAMLKIMAKALWVSTYK
jgi:hypothetical protein